MVAYAVALNSVARSLCVVVSAAACAALSSGAQSLWCDVLCTHMTSTMIYVLILFCACLQKDSLYNDKQLYLCLDSKKLQIIVKATNVLQ